MALFERHNLGLHASATGDSIHEQWVSGTYVVAGVFQQHCEHVQLRQIVERIPHYFESLRLQKKAIWPRGICGYYTIPIYSVEHFDDDALRWVRSRPSYRYAMWHEPVLYDWRSNRAEMNRQWGINGSAFRIFLYEVIASALVNLMRHYDHAERPTLNGDRLTIGIT